MGKYCVKCGNQLEENVKFCSNCGHEVGSIVYNNQNVNNNVNQGGKSKLAAGILGILLGALGIHNFYIGNTDRAAVQLSITIGCSLLILCTLGISSIGLLAMYIWGFVEGIQILSGSIATDANGVPFKD